MAAAYDDEAEKRFDEADSAGDTSAADADTAPLDDDVWREPMADPDTVEPAEITSADLVTEEVDSGVLGAILRAARAAGVKAVFAEGRRASDITLVLLKGDRFDVLALAPNLVEDQQLDLEVMRSDEIDGVYELMLAVTDKLETQSVHLPERRKKLLRFVEAELARDENSWSQGK